MIVKILSIMYCEKFNELNLGMGTNKGSLFILQTIDKIVLILYNGTWCHFFP